MSREFGKDRTQAEKAVYVEAKRAFSATPQVFGVAVPDPLIAAKAKVRLWRGRAARALPACLAARAQASPRRSTATGAKALARAAAGTQDICSSLKAVSNTQLDSDPESSPPMKKRARLAPAQAVALSDWAPNEVSDSKIDWRELAHRLVDDEASPEEFARNLGHIPQSVRAAFRLHSAPEEQRLAFAERVLNTLDQA